MKHYIPIILVFCFTVSTLRAQEFMNGDFEINNGTPGANYGNINNTQFNALLPFCHSFAPTTSGMTGSLDLLTGLNGPPYSGNWYVGVVSYPLDIFTMELSQPLLPGQRYRISFYQRNQGWAFPLQLGLSTAADDFGELIHTAPVSVTGIWEENSFEFEAPNTGKHIGVRMMHQPQLGVWAAVDHFTIDPVPCEPVLDLGPDRALCNGQSLLLNPQAPAQHTYLWSDQSTAPTLTVTQPGTYWVVATRGACSDSDTVVVNAGEVPEVVFEADRTGGCAPLPVTFTYTGHAQPGYTYAWLMDDGTTHTGASPTHVYTPEGCHDVGLTVTNTQGCTATRTLAAYVCVYPAPEAAFTYAPNPVFVDDPRVQFTNTSTGHAASDWQLGDGSTDTEENPQHTYAIGQGADYTIRLAVVSELGCADTAWDTVTVRFPFDVFVPNAFTPNGDTRNPIFLPMVAAPFDVKEYQLQIFDRWGTRLFSTTDLLHGWDGTLNQKNAPTGIYTWKISTRNPYTHREWIKTGHVMLLK